MVTALLTTVLLFCSQQTDQLETACINAFVSKNFIYREVDETVDLSAKAWNDEYWYGDCSEYATVLSRTLRLAGFKVKLAYVVTDPVNRIGHVYVMTEGTYIDNGGVHIIIPYSPYKIT